MNKKLLLLFGWCSIIVLVVYGSALRLPFFFDDLDHIPFAIEHSHSDIWRDAGGFPYYRPLGISILRLMVGVFGPTNSTALHALNLLLHAINGWLVGILCLLLFQRRGLLLAFLASLFYLLFPFSYQAVPWVGAVFHLLVTGILLGAVIGYLLFRQSHNWGWALLSLFLTVLAIFAHENGVWAGILIAFLIVQENGKLLARPFRLIVRDLILWGVPAVVALLIWVSRTSVAEEGSVIVNAETLLQNSSYFAQGIVYPLNWMGGWLVRQGFNDLLMVWVAAFIALLFFWYVLSKQENRWWPAIFFMLWIVSGSLLSVLFLPFQYVIDGPRLLMVASVGIAGLWALAVVALWSWGYFGRISAILLILLAIAPSAIFINQRMTLHSILGEGFNATVAATAQADLKDREAVFVNVRTWLSAQEATYALGHEGVLFLPDYMFPQQIIEVNLGQNLATGFVQFADLIDDLPYYGDVAGSGPIWADIENEPSDVYLMNYAERPVSAELVGRFQLDATQETALGVFQQDGSIVLESAEYLPETAQLKLTWRVEGNIAPEHTVFVHGLDQNGSLVTQDDGHPLQGMYPFSFFEPGIPIQDYRMLAADDISSISIGIYNSGDGQRWPTSTGEDHITIPIR